MLGLLQLPSAIESRPQKASLDSPLKLCGKVKRITALSSYLGLAPISTSTVHEFMMLVHSTLK